MPGTALTDELINERIRVYREGGNNTSEAARRLEISRQAMQYTVNRALSSGLLDPEDIDDPNIPNSTTYAEAKRRKLEFARKKTSKGNWRKPTLIQMPPGPFILKVFGDPHIDADSFELELFEKNWLEMSEENHVYGLCVGDFFNNWLRALGHLWKEDGSDPSDAWTIFAHLMGQRGGALLAACSGNHDDWTHAPYDPIEMMMRQHGVRYKKGAISLILGLDNPFTVAMRHKWRGNSMYSAAHGLKRGAIFGWNDDLLIGGHIHQDEITDHVHANGDISKLVQISAFKSIDNHADVQGFMGPRISPVVNLVINPARDKKDPDRIQPTWDFEKAMALLEYERGRQ